MREEEMTETKNSKIALLPSWQPHVISLHFPGYIVLIDCFLKFLFLVSCCFKFLTKFLLTFHSNTHISSSFLLVYVSNVVAPPVQRSFVRFRASPLLICCDYNLGLHKMEQLSPIPPKAMMKARRSKKRAILASLKWGEGWSRSVPFILSKIVAWKLPLFSGYFAEKLLPYRWPTKAKSRHAIGYDEDGSKNLRCPR